MENKERTLHLPGTGEPLTKPAMATKAPATKIIGLRTAMLKIMSQRLWYKCTSGQIKVRRGVLQKVEIPRRARSIGRRCCCWKAFILGRMGLARFTPTEVKAIQALNQLLGSEFHNQRLLNFNDRLIIGQEMVHRGSTVQNYLVPKLGSTYSQDIRCKSILVTNAKMRLQ